MTGHLPECPVINGAVCPHDPRCNCQCMCKMLRACEQRVRMEDDDYAYVAAQAEADGRWQGWAEALDAARNETLSFLVDEEVRLPANWLVRSIAAAIDALREERR